MREEHTGWLDWWSRRLGLTEIFSLLTSYGLFHGELDHRKPPREALAEALRRPMPSYARWPRILGLAAVVLIAILGVTGVLLTLYYAPTPEAAHATTGNILSSVSFGGFVYQIHYWGAQFLIAVLMVRLVRFFYQRVYSPPRELVWVLASLLLLVAFHSELTGRALPWTGVGYWSAVRALEVLQAIPIYGWLVALLSGSPGAAITDLTLLRFYILHIAALPLLLMLLIYLHFSSVRQVGFDPSTTERRGADEVGIREHFLNLAVLLTVLVGALVTLGILEPRTLPAAADPYATLVGVPPPWYLLAPFGWLELTAGWLPRWAAGTVLGLVAASFVLLPFLTPPPLRRRSRFLMASVAGVAIVAWLALTLYGASVA